MNTLTGECVCMEGTVLSSSGACVATSECVKNGMIVSADGSACVARSKCVAIDYTLKACVESCGDAETYEIQSSDGSTETYCKCDGYVRGASCYAACPNDAPYVALHDGNRRECVGAAECETKQCRCDDRKIFLDTTCECDASRGYETVASGCQCAAGSSESTADGSEKRCISKEHCVKHGKVLDTDSWTCIGKDECYKSNVKGLGPDGASCISCTSQIKQNQFWYCRCESGSIVNNECVDRDCQELRYYNTSIGKVCLAAGEVCQNGKQCSCEQNRIYDAASGTCVCDAANGYYLYGSSCTLCNDCLTEDGT